MSAPLTVNFIFHRGEVYVRNETAQASKLRQYNRDLKLELP